MRLKTKSGPQTIFTSQTIFIQEWCVRLVTPPCARRAGVSTMLSPVDSTQEELDDATTPRRATASEIRIECVQPDSEVAALLLNRYYDNLDRRFPDGFDVNRTVAATTAELRLPHGAFLAVFLGVDPVGCGAVR
jgi:hypothetical protein